MVINKNKKICVLYTNIIVIIEYYIINNIYNPRYIKKINSSMFSYDKKEKNHLL
jgi:hypothetical protein